MDEGWIKLYRVIKKHWIWEDPKKLKWWLDILLSANHQERKVLLGNDLILINRGSFHTSELKLSEKWGVSKTTVRKFLELLKNDRMIDTEKTKKGTTIKISNYEDYQGISEEEKTIKKPQKNHKKTIEEPYAIPQKNHKVDTNKNDKNYKNDKEGEEGKEEVHSLSPLSFPSEIYKTIFDEVGEIGYRTWFMESEIVVKGELITITVNEEFKKDIIQSRYLLKLRVVTGKKISVKVGGT